MKKNMMFIGMLVALLIVPNYTFARKAKKAQVVDSAIVAEAIDTIAPVAAAEAATVEAAAAEEVAVETAAVEEAAAEEVIAPVKEKKVREPRVQVIDSTHYSYGSVINVHFGFGMSGLWATEGNAQLQNSWGFPGFNVGLRYSYYFLSWLGFTTGLDYSTYMSDITMTGVMDWQSANKNNLGNNYLHRLNFSGEGEAQSTWKETESLGMIEIPIALSFKYKPNKVGLLSTIGLKLGFPVKGRYSYEGNLNHTGYHQELGYLEQNDRRFLANDAYSEPYKDYAKSTWSVINAEVFGEIGALFQVHERIDLSLSLYGSYGVNDINKTAYNDRVDLGFRTAEQAVRAPEMNVTCMNAYNGLIGTKAIDHINPWNCGVKIGVHIYCADENDAERARRLAQHDVAPAPAEPQIIYIRDTVREEIRDTVTIEKQVVVHDTVVNQIEKVTKLLEKVIIYYKVGDSKTPIINPSNLLDDAAAIIAANPSIRVSVEGHASSDGNAAYNQKLSKNRAENVASILREKGVKDSQIEIQAYGSSHPLKFGSQDDPDKDRRVEIIPITAEITQ